VLSRIAESMFWIGRYLERADGTARILDVHLQLLLEDPWLDEDASCRVLLGVMGTPAEQGLDVPVTREQVLDRLAYGAQPGSIVASLRAARENARRAREVVSIELLESLKTRPTMPSRPATVRGGARTTSSTGCASGSPWWGASRTPP
jgi:uncharacterized alpha-E superfamily protein